MAQKEQLSYSHTNENLRSVVSGLDLNDDDRVLSVLGSGDQAFAFLEYAKHVVAVDTSNVQIDYAIKRAEQLRTGDFKGFLKSKQEGTQDSVIFDSFNVNFGRYVFKKRNDYFRQKKNERMRDIKNNLDNLTVLSPQNVLDTAQNVFGFSKIYLSNVLGYKGYNFLETARIFQRIALTISSGGLIYVANNDKLIELLRFCSENNLDDDCSDSSLIPKELVFDTRLSFLARKYETGLWSPAVYRKN